MLSITGNSVEGASVADCTALVGSMIIGDSVGDVGELVHPTNVAITIKVKLVRGMIHSIRVGLGHLDIDLGSLKRTIV